MCEEIKKTAVELSDEETGKATGGANPTCRVSYCPNCNPNFDPTAPVGELLTVNTDAPLADATTCPKCGATLIWS